MLEWIEGVSVIESLCRFDGLVERGCFDGETVPCDKGYECVTCRSNFCNTHMFLKGSCLSCRTDLNGKCATSLAHMTSDDPDDIDADCPITYDMPLCYTIFGPMEVERGCTAKLYQPIYERECGPTRTCHYCDSDLCNYWRRVPEGFQFFETRSGVGSRMFGVEQGGVFWVAFVGVWWCKSRF